MNWDRIEGNWKQLRDKLAGGLQNSYGIAKDKAEKQINAFAAKCESNQWVQ